MEKIYFVFFNFLSNFFRLLPNWLRKLCSHILAWLMILFGHERNQVLAQNLEICIKGLNKHQKILTINFQSKYQITYYHAIVLLDYLSAFSMSEAELKNTVEVVGGENLQKGSLIFFPHFIGLSVGSWITTRIFKTSLIYSPPKQKVLAKWLVSKYCELIPNRTYKKNDSIIPLARLIKKGQLIQLSTDLDVGDRDTLLSSFFEIPAFTSKALPFFIDKYSPNLVGAVCTYIGDQSARFRYKLHFEPIDLDLTDIKKLKLPREHYLHEIQKKLNIWLEDQIRQHPMQYWWFHKRFKTAKAKGLLENYKKN